MAVQVSRLSVVVQSIEAPVLGWLFELVPVVHSGTFAGNIAPTVASTGGPHRRAKRAAGQVSRRDRIGAATWRSLLALQAYRSHWSLWTLRAWRTLRARRSNTAEPSDQGVRHRGACEAPLTRGGSRARSHVCEVVAASLPPRRLGVAVPARGG
jgi:hypothetical protein